MDDFNDLTNLENDFDDGYVDPERFVDVQTEFIGKQLKLAWWIDDFLIVFYKFVLPLTLMIGIVAREYLGLSDGITFVLIGWLGTYFNNPEIPKRRGRK